MSTTTKQQSKVPELRFTSNKQEWDTVLLDEVTQRGSGHTPSKSHSGYYDGEIPWVSLADSSKLDAGGISKTKYTISEDGIKNSSAVLHPKGTVLLSRDAGIGKSAVMGLAMAVSQHFITWKCSDRLNNWYLYYYLQKEKREFERMAVGSTIKTIGLPYFKKLTISLPPRIEQDKISDFLKSADEWLDSLRLQKASLEAYKKGITQKLFTQEIRFKDEDSGNFLDWEVRKLAEVVKRITCKNKNANSNVLTISSALGLVNQLEYYNHSYASKDLSNYTLINKGDFAYNKSYSANYPMGAIKRLKKYTSGVVSPLYICFRIANNKAHDGLFLEYYFEAGLFNPEISRIAQEGARNHGLLNMSMDDFFNNTNLNLPSLPEQQKIANFLTSLDKGIESKQQQITKAEEWKKGLMQKMFI